MGDELFPSGEWTGFYNYKPTEKFRMDIALEFSKGSMAGQGCDNIGTFLIKGRYDPDTKECFFTKSYLGAHSVYYKGCRESKGIWGTWEIGAFASGGFHIWPRKSGTGKTETLEEEFTQPVEAIGMEGAEVELNRPGSQN
jgi:hypothetical protein